MSGDEPRKKAVYKVLYDFKATAAREIKVTKNELVYALGPNEGGWMKVKPVRHPDIEGYVPYMFLKRSTAIARPQGRGEPTVELAGENAGIQHAECSICFRPMIAERPVSYLLKTDAKTRTCRHYFHRTCLVKRLKAKSVPQCAVCHTPYEGFADVPDFDIDPEGFFEVIDFDRNLKLNKAEVIAILKALVDVDYKKVEEDVDMLWDLWDKNGDGTISFQEMMRPKTGLLHYTRDRYPPPKPKESAPPPQLTEKTKKNFFKYWDEDMSGCLSIDEIYRAVIKTYLKDDPSEVDAILQTLNAIWPLFDDDGNGTLDEEEFCKAGGLGDMLMANFKVQ